MPTVHSHGASVYYEIYGDGPAVVFAHGADGNTLSWFQQIPHFARSYRVILFDVRGWGRSYCPPERADLRYASDDLLAILDAERVQRAALVGMSIGGWASMRAAVDQPERVACLVLIGSAGGIVTPELFSAFSKLLEQGAAGEQWMDRFLAPDFREREPVLAFLHDQIQGLNPPFDPTLVQGAIDAQVHPEELTGYDVPTLLIYGALDALQGTELLLEVASMIPGLETAELGGTGPSPHFEAAEAFNPLAEEFIALHHRK